MGNIGNKRGHFPANYVSKADTFESESSQGAVSQGAVSGTNNSTAPEDTAIQTTGTETEGTATEPETTTQNYIFQVQANFDFVSENEGDLTFYTGDVINVISQLDDDWFSGELNGVVGIFPVNYVVRL